MSRRTAALLASSGVLLVGLYLAVSAVFVRLIALVVGETPSTVAYAAVAILVSLVFGYVSYRAGTVRLLASIQATELPRARAPEVYAVLDVLSGEMGVEPPRVLVTRMGAPNALALGGGRRGVVVLDRLLFSLLSRDELAGVLAHELAHLERRDALFQTLGASLVQTVAGMCSVLLLPVSLLVALVERVAAWFSGYRTVPFDEHLARTHAFVARAVLVAMLAFTLVLRAHSRQRELEADDRAAAVTGDPLALARALARIERASDPRRGLLSSLFIYGNEEGTLTRLLATHPPMGDRIERLRERADRDARRIPIR